MMIASQSSKPCFFLVCTTQSRRLLHTLIARFSKLSNKKHMKNTILIANLFLDLGGNSRFAPTSSTQGNKVSESNSAVSAINLDGAADLRHRRDCATILSNLAYFGYAPSVEVLRAFQAMSTEDLALWWGQVEPAFRGLTGDDRPMAEFVVYKNFPQEVLDMTQADYWFNQICMYIGAPVSWFAQPAAERAPLARPLNLKVLALADEDSLPGIYRALVANSARWSDDQKTYAAYLARELQVRSLVLNDFGFKENGIVLIAGLLDTEGELSIEDATDIWRLASAMSGADAGLRGNVVFRSFSRSERRLLLSFLDEAKNLLADMSMRPALWKKFLAKLHPGDFKFKRVSEAYDALYRGDYKTFNGQVEAGQNAKDPGVLAHLQSRPGEMARRLHKLYAIFGMQAIEAFGVVAPKLTTVKLLKLHRYASTINARQHLVHPPKGNWSKAQFKENKKTPFSEEALLALNSVIDPVLQSRMAQAFPEGVALDAACQAVKLQTNDQELASYGRGTSFDIPPGVNFIRTASYWEHPLGRTVWYDNGFNFMDAQWQPMGSCCWNVTDDMEGAAAFSGDPLSANNPHGRACQLIDLYIDKLVERGVRYAVWNILCFSHSAFAEANEVLATLQWGDDAQAGELFEPSRAQMVFPLKGTNLTKYIAYLDLVERKLVYMDANLPGQVQSAKDNEFVMAARMPAMVEYLNSLPSVADLFTHAPVGATPVLYSDEDVTFEPGTQAYVFAPRNAANTFKSVDLSAVLQS